MKMTSDSELDFLPAAGQMRLTEIQKAQIKRAREIAMEELKSVLDRVRLTMHEYTTAENELQIIESPDPEFEAEQEEQKMRERKMKRKERRAKRKMERPEGEKEEEDDGDGEKERNGRYKKREALDQTSTSATEEKDGEEGTSPESYGDLSGSSTEDDSDKEDEDADERETKQEIWTVPGQVQRKTSQKTLLRVSEKIRELSNKPKPKTRLCLPLWWIIWNKKALTM